MPFPSGWNNEHSRTDIKTRIYKDSIRQVLICTAETKSEIFKTREEIKVCEMT